MDLQIGEKAPDFTLKNTEGTNRTLSNMTDKANVVLLFFPLAFSSVCTDELCIARDDLSEYQKLNARIIGVSVDSFFTLKEFKEKYDLDFELLSDFNKEVSKQYDCLYENFFHMYGVSKRAAFVIEKGSRVIRYIEILEDAGKQPSFDRIQEALK